MNRRMERGHLLYGLAGIIVVTSVMTLLVLSRALESGVDAARLEQRLAWRAAAEGAALIAEAAEPLTEVAVGDRSFTAQFVGDGTNRRIVLTPVTEPDRPPAEQQFEVTYARNAEGQWRVQRVLSRGMNP